MDITYIKVSQGFLYMTTLIDVVSRCVMGYHVSPFLDTNSCLSALQMALETGHRPTIINSDQGCQFTSQEWLYSLSLLGIHASMDGKGRWADNIPIERFWRTLKYEEVYLKTYNNVPEAKENLASYIDCYNTKRRHSGLGKNRPFELANGQKTATDWPFKQRRGYVDNCDQLPHRSTPSTTSTTAIFNNGF